MTTLEFQHKLIHLQKHLIIFAYRLTSDKENARDLLQETNLKVLDYRDKFVHDTNFKAWTFTIMKNTFINSYRRSKLYTTINEQNNHSLTVHQIKSERTLDPASMLESKELEKIVESIDDKFKVPFKMQQEGYKYREIAEILDLKLGTVKSRIFFARKKLIKQLK